MSLYDPAELKAIEDNYNARLRTTEAYELCSRLALSDDQLAEHWGIDLHTLLDWKLAYTGFLDAIETGRTLAPVSLQSSLYRAATGYVVQVIDKRHGRHQIRHVPPNIHACTFWLKHRDPEQWGSDMDSWHPLSTD